MIAAFTSFFSDIIDWIGSVISSLLQFGNDVFALNPLFQLFVVGFAIIALFFGFKFIKSIVWGV